MARDLTPMMAAQVSASFKRPILLADIEFVDQTVYVHTGIGPKTWNGNTYLGVGNFGGVSTVGENSDVAAQGIVLTLSGVDSGALAECMGQLRQGKRARVYLGFLDVDGSILDAVALFQGMVDQPEINVAPVTSTIHLSVENRLSDLNRARGGRLTDQDQRQRHPTDGSLQWVAWLQDQHFNWK
jgi:hypothetical protein